MVVLHSLAIAEDFVIPVLFRNGQEDVRIMVVSVGSIVDRTSYLEQYYAWTENGFFFFFEGFDTFTDLNSDAFISWLREKNCNLIFPFGSQTFVGKTRFLNYFPLLVELRSLPHNSRLNH